MAEIAKHILKMIIPEKIEPKDKKILLNLSAHKLKITEKNADIIKTIIQKYAPFELLTTGWGQEEEKREKKKEKSINESSSMSQFDETTQYTWKLLTECKFPTKTYYLIYKKEK